MKSSGEEGQNLVEIKGQAANGCREGFDPPRLVEIKWWAEKKGRGFDPPRLSEIERQVGKGGLWSLILLVLIIVWHAEKKVQCRSNHPRLIKIKWHVAKRGG